MNICLFSKEEINKPLDAFDERAIHLDKVLHKNVGDTFNCGVINGKAGIATITKVTEVFNEKSQKIQRGFEFTFEATNDGKLLNPLVLIVGFVRPIQLKRAMRDAAGLGVKEVHLTCTELTEKSYINSKMVQEDEVSKFLLDGTIQAASTHVPKVFYHNSLNECIESVNSSCINFTKILLDNIKAKSGLQNFLIQKKPSSVVAAIGSERGWTDNERNLFIEKGFTLCSMGERVLRTETALTVSTSIILSNMNLLN